MGAKIYQIKHTSSNSFGGSSI